MKERAGVVGARGLNPLLRELRADRPDTRIHLIGHSFGGRLVTAATVGSPGDQPVALDTVSLLQAAFSHFGFANHYEGDKDGFFRRMVTDDMVRGPVLITHSVHDTAVGYAYPLASRLAGQNAAGLGDAGDRFGGIGRNGAQKTPEAIACQLQEAGKDYAFASPSVVNLNADDTDLGAQRHPQRAGGVRGAVGGRGARDRLTGQSSSAMRPWRWASVAASTRPETPSLTKIRETWTLAVFGLM